MTRSRTPARSTGLGIVLAALAVIVSLAFGPVRAADARDDGLSKEDKACLACHAKPDLGKTLAGGETLSLHVRAKPFADSVHGSEGCEACHSEIDLDSHGKQAKPLAGRREQSRVLNEACTDCHKKTVKLYADSVHAALVQQGSDKAPLCSDCHDPHATRPAKQMAAADAAPCRTCHEGITKAYADSVHAQGGAEALSCADCHRAHDVKAASLGEHLKDECLSCHREVAATHKTWLPNTERHLQAISCAACHAPGAQRRVNLRFYDSATQRQASEKVGVPQFKKLAHAADTSGSGLDARALWSLLQEFNRDAGEGKTVLRGRLEVRSGEQAHRLATRSQALADCDTCHREGAEAFQSVTVSMAGPDGRPLRHDARPGVLSAVESIEAVGGFYAIGSTRIELLDTLLLLTLAAAIGVPATHLTVKWLARRNRRQDATPTGDDE